MQYILGNAGEKESVSTEKDNDSAELPGTLLRD